MGVVPLWQAAVASPVVRARGPIRVKPSPDRLCSPLVRTEHCRQGAGVSQHLGHGGAIKTCDVGVPSPVVLRLGRLRMASTDRVRGRGRGVSRRFAWPREEKRASQAAQGARYALNGGDRVDWALQEERPRNIATLSRMRLRALASHSQRSMAPLYFENACFCTDHASDSHLTPRES